jgi:hypothetical protein
MILFNNITKKMKRNVSNIHNNCSVNKEKSDYRLVAHVSHSLDDSNSYIQTFCQTIYREKWTKRGVNICIITFINIIRASWWTLMFLLLLVSSSLLLFFIFSLFEYVNTLLLLYLRDFMVRCIFQSSQFSLLKKYIFFIIIILCGLCFVDYGKHK